MSTTTSPRTLDAKQREWVQKMGSALSVNTASPSKLVDVPVKGILGDLLDVIGEFKAITSRITIKNESNLKLRLLFKAVETPPSAFKEEPPTEVDAQDEVDFSVTNSVLGPISHPGGTGGNVKYEIVGDDKQTKLFMKWERGFKFPSLKTTQTVIPDNPEKYVLRGKNTTGDDFMFTFKVKGAPGPGPGPSPGPTPPPGPSTEVQSSCLITVHNKTNVPLTLVDQGKDKESGDFMSIPDSTIDPGKKADVVYIETPSSKDVGCKGFLVYEVGSPSTAIWRVEWDNPKGKMNTTTTSLEPQTAGFRSLDQIGQGDENVPVVFTISGGGGGGPVPPPPSTAKKLKITVVDSAEQPIPDALVEITDIKGAFGALAKKSGKTDAKGKVDFDLPPAQGTMQVSVRANANGFEEHRLVYKLPDDGFDQTIHLEKPASAKKLAITVVDSGDKPLPGVLVEIETDAENVKLPKKSDKTNDKGKVEFELPSVEKTFTLKAQATLTGFDVEKRAYKLPDDGFEHVIHLKSASRVRTANFTVQDTTEHKPLPGATVEIAGKSKPTDERGRAEFELPPGTHPYVVKKEEFLPSNGKIEMPADKDVFETVLMSKATEKKTFEPPDQSKEPTLRRGAPKGDKWVEYLQKLLGFEGKDVDGDFGGKTEKAVRDYQTKNKLKVDGIAGNQTWASLRKAPAEKPSTDGRAPNTFVEKGQEARWYTEKKAEVLTFQGDALKLKLVSLGDKEVEGVMARVRLTAAGGLEHTDDYRISAAEKKLPEGGFIHSVSVPNVSSRFPAGNHKLLVEAYMPKDLGGDLFKDEIDVTLSARRP